MKDSKIHFELVLLDATLQVTVIGILKRSDSLNKFWRKITPFRRRSILFDKIKKLMKGKRDGKTSSSNQIL